MNVHWTEDQLKAITDMANRAHAIDVYVGNYDNYVIPADVMATARRLNAGKSLNDRRTKGARHIAWWGRCQDGNRETVELLKKYAQ